MLGDVKDSTLGRLLTVSRKAAEATSALRPVNDRPCCCGPGSSSVELVPFPGPVATFGNRDIVGFQNTTDAEGRFSI